MHADDGLLTQPGPPGGALLFLGTWTLSYGAADLSPLGLKTLDKAFEQSKVKMTAGLM